MSIYVDIRNAVRKELIKREQLLPEQRTEAAINTEALTISKKVIGHILQTIEEEWQP
jgi:hypothetical protein